MSKMYVYAIIIYF